MKNVIVILVMMSLLHATVLPINAERGHRGPAGMAGWSRSLYDADLTAGPKLNLTADQKTRIEALRLKYGSDIESLRAQLYEKKRELKAEWLRSDPERMKIQSLRNEAKALNKQLREQLAGYRQEVLYILTAEQRDQLAEARGGLHHQQRQSGWKTFEE